MVWRTVARILKRPDDALDCCQDVFAEAIERGRRKAVTNWGAFLRWLATRRAIDHLRRRNRRSGSVADPAQVRDVLPSAEEQVSFIELVELVRSELAFLPEQQAEAFWLVCVEQSSYEEVAQQMGVERNTVGVLVHRARQHMRTKLKSLDPMQAKQE
jgi:RNA polymerase sigma factor (sigma-70 family)